MGFAGKVDQERAGTGSWQVPFEELGWRQARGVSFWLEYGEKGPKLLDSWKGEKGTFGNRVGAKGTGMYPRQCWVGEVKLKARSAWAPPLPCEDVYRA